MCVKERDHIFLYYVCGLEDTILSFSFKTKKGNTPKYEKEKRARERVRVRESERENGKN